MRNRLLYFLLPLSLLFFSYKENTHRELQFENDKVKVWKTIIYPGSPLKFHRHDQNRVIVGLKGGKLLKVEEDGSKSDLIFEDHKAYYLESDPPGELHADINTENYPIEVIVMEFKD
ncbi:MAG: hypothetical protein S4CHLAM37_15470 [Chlamydiia bacterium]|nr:hypothetical protein [Chlamydiia bacterium]